MRFCLGQDAREGLIVAIEVGKSYLCTKSFTHPNLGRMFRKGTHYVCAHIDHEYGLYRMNGKNGGSICCDEDFINSHFAV